MLNFIIRGCTCRLYEGGDVFIPQMFCPHPLCNDEPQNMSRLQKQNCYVSTAVRVYIHLGVYLDHEGTALTWSHLVTHDIHQGSVRGPLLFILNILPYLGHTTTWSHVGIITVTASFIDPKNSINCSMYTILIHTHSRLPLAASQIAKHL